MLISTTIPPYTLNEEWLEAQSKTLKELKAEVEGKEQLESFAKRIDDYSDLHCQKNHVVADFYWQTDRNKYIAGSNGTRYTYPFDHARTCREIGKDFFVNASDIEKYGQKYIASQSPLTTTYVDFWKMVIYKNSPTIVALNMSEEDKDEPEPRPVEYWKQNPDKFGTDWDKWQEIKKLDQGTKAVNICSFDTWTILCIDSKVVAEDNEYAIVQRDFLAINSDTKEERKISQFHFQNWPDFEAGPSTELLIKLIKIVDVSHPSDQKPLTVHCAAGMGRAGEFIAMRALIRKVQKQLAKGKKIDECKVNLPKIIYKMRDCRKDMVSENGMLSCVKAFELTLQNCQK